MLVSQSFRPLLVEFGWFGVYRFTIDRAAPIGAQVSSVFNFLYIIVINVF